MAANQGNFQSYPPGSNAGYDQGQPPPYAAPPGVHRPQVAQPYYPAPATGYGYPPGPQQQQQSTVIVNSAPPTVVTSAHYYQSFAGHIVLSCISFWLCGGLFGLIGFILALVAQSTSATDPQAARKLGHASLGVSIAGMVIFGILMIILYAVGIFVNTCPHYKNDECYQHAAYYTSSSMCYLQHTDYYWDGSTCYYNN